jgi:hypothetical protein
VPELLIRIKKKADGSAALSCTRADGSVTWQRQDGRLGAFFPLHDLAHYAVETVLGHRRGFYGLVAEGWDLTDFGPPWPRGKISVEAAQSELLVGFFDLERASGHVFTAADCKDMATSYRAEHGVPHPPEPTDEQLALIRRRRGELFARWRAVLPGETLELRFDRRETPARAAGPAERR